MYYTGIDPFTKEQVYVARGLKDRRLQRIEASIETQPRVVVTPVLAMYADLAHGGRERVAKAKVIRHPQGMHAGFIGEPAQLDCFLDRIEAVEA